MGPVYRSLAAKDNPFSDYWLMPDGSIVKNPYAVGNLFETPSMRHSDVDVVGDRLYGVKGDPFADLWLMPNGSTVKNPNPVRSNPIETPPLRRHSTLDSHVLVFDGDFAPDMEVVRSLGKLVVVENINAVPFSSDALPVPLHIAFPELELPDGPDIYLKVIDGVVTRHEWTPEE